MVTTGGVAEKQCKKYFEEYNVEETGNKMG
jgi:hypothetical protein